METSQYLEMFLDESREHLQAVNDHLLKLEKQPQDLKIIDEIFRSAHTLKGMSATMGFDDIASLTHQMENVLDKLRKAELSVTTDVVDAIFEALEYLEEMVGAISEGKDGKKDVSELVSRLERMEKGNHDSSDHTDHKPESEELEQESQSPGLIELDDYQLAIVSQSEEQGYRACQMTIQLNESCILKAVRIFMVFEILEQIGEVIKSVPTAEDLQEENFERDFSVVLLTKESDEDIQNRILKVSEIENVEVSHLSLQGKEETKPSNSEQEGPKPSNSEQEGPKSSNVSKSSKTIRVNIERIDDLMNLFEELVIDRGRLEDLSKEINEQELSKTTEHISRVSQDMQSLLLTMRMVPVEQVFNRFPRMVRGLAKDLDKKINLEIIGAETELDRTVVDEIGDPLVHLIRNSIDHGIESPVIRQQNGKSAEGKLLLRAYHSGNHVFIEIEDDGGGINREKVVKKAIENGLITAESSQSLSDEEVYRLIFSSGFSTAEQVSDVSGRGVGLDVVRSKIESLGGNIHIETEQGKGSKFSIKLPLTLSILSTLLVQVQKEVYAIPLSTIMETILLKEDKIMKIQNQEVMDYREKVIPLVFLKDVFKVPVDQDNRDNQDPYHAIVIVKDGEKMAGLVVDSFIGQKEVVLKSLGSHLQDAFAISGATILGNGQVSLIIDSNALIK